MILSIIALLLLVALGYVVFLIVRNALARQFRVINVDWERYQGTWYEAASYPQWFQKGCSRTTAEYRLGGVKPAEYRLGGVKPAEYRLGSTKNAEIQVINRCWLAKENRWKEAQGKAVVRGPNALQVSFGFPPLFIPLANYFVVALDEENYEWAAVGSKDRDSLWILVRDPARAEYWATNTELRNFLIQVQGFSRADIENKLQLTRQDVE